MMKKNLLFVLFAMFCLIETANAQFDYIGGGITLATPGELRYNGYSYYNKAFGIDLRANYDYSKKIIIVPDFKFYLPNTEKFVVGESKTTVFALNINAHFILNSKTRNSYRLYLLGGAHVGAWSLKDNHAVIAGNLDVKTFRFVPGANVGAGMHFPLGSTIFFAEAKYVIAKANRLVFTPGFLFVL